MVKLISKQIAVSTLEPSIRLDDVLRSYDLEDTQFEIKVLNEDLDLTDATIHCVTKYFSHGKSYAFEKLVKPKSKDVIVFSLPEELKGYDGKIYVGLYAELGDERVDIKDIEVTINNSIIDEDIDFSTVNYFESFERMVEKVDLATEDALDNIKHDKEHVALSRDYAERKMDEDIEEVDTRAKEVLESINDKDKKVNELADKLNTDIEDFEQIKITAKETSDNAVREISQTKDTVISEIESVSDSFKAKKTEFDTVVNGITTSIDTKAKDLGTYTEEQKLHIDEKTKSFNTLVDEKTGELTKLNNTFNQELEKAGVTLTTAQDLINRIGTLEQKEDKDTVYNDTEIKQSVADVDTKVDNLSEKVTALEERPIVDTALTERVEALEAKEDKDTVYDDTNLKAQITELKNRGLCVAYMVPNSLEDPIGGGMRFEKEDSGNPVQFMYANLIGISLKDSDNQDDYIWVPAQGFVSRYLTATSSEISKQIEESAEENKRRNEAVLTILNDDISPRISKLEQKRPPYGYRLNRKADPWELIFDNGCILTFPLDTIHNYYGWNESPIKITTSRPYNASPYSTPEMIMWYVKGHRTVEYLKTSSPSSYTEFINCELKNPINDSSLYNFDNAFGDASDDTLIGKRNFVKLLYELDALIEDDLLSVGVTKKEDK
ncbi:hypothetical protein [Enterococcus cecorum]|uniref:hypothetical protein n=1 Tax=Enterococcus cecorum TaxID=44008 RepID=UPI00148D3378|nr:hypothetical protein [Enterococcus cecorum]